MKTNVLIQYQGVDTQETFGNGTIFILISRERSTIYNRLAGTE